MLSQWFGGKTEDAKAAEVKAAKKPRMTLDPEAASKQTEEEISANREAAFERKLRESIKEGPAHPNNMVTYEAAFRNAQRVLMEGNMGETTEGLQLSMGRNSQNCMVNTKWTLGNPQQSNWEVSLQMNGFSDMTSVSYSTLNRWSMMHQRIFRSGAMGLVQLFSQSQGGMFMGNFVGLLQYPWVTGGATQVQYVKGQALSLSHMQRVIRGVYIGSCLNYDPNTHATSMTYAAMAHNPKKTVTLAGEMKPESGEWKVSYTRQEWTTDNEVSIQLENTEKRNGLMSFLSIGVRQQLIGGGVLNCVLSGFSKLRGVVELPFGGERQGFNQVRVSYNVQYDIQAGGLKQGISFSL